MQHKTQAEISPAVKKSRRMLTLLFILLAMPFIIGVSLYLTNWRPTKTSNFGELVNPVIPMREKQIWQKYWTLLLLHNAQCLDTCAQRLDGLRRIRTALAKEYSRTRHGWLGEGIASAGEQIKIQQKDVLIFSGRFEQYISNTDSIIDGQIVIIDPRGNLMMRYPPNADLKAITKDLERLLKTSWAI